MRNPQIHIYDVDFPEGKKHFVSVLPTETVFSHGLLPESIVGALLRPFAAGERITPDVFVRNSVFVKFMHDIVAKYAPLDPELDAEAKRQGIGWVYIVDRRTKNPHGAVPPEDIIGAFEVSDGKFVHDSYRASPRHLVLSADGFFQLTPSLHAALSRELQSRLNPT